jgi:hypothetical protein
MKTEKAMLNSIKKLSVCRILANDGEVGAVAEAVYFDDEQWVVRYLVVDTRAWLRGRKVLISPYAVTFNVRAPRNIILCGSTPIAREMPSHRM